MVTFMALGRFLGLASSVHACRHGCPGDPSVQLQHALQARMHEINFVSLFSS